MALVLMTPALAPCLFSLLLKIKSLPGIDHRPVTALSWTCFLRRLEPANNPASGFERIDYRVNFQRYCHAQGLALLVVLGYQLFEERFLCGFVTSLRKFILVPQAHCTFQPHASKLSGGPSHGEERIVEGASGHTHGTKPIAFAQHNSEHGNLQA